MGLSLLFLAYLALPMGVIVSFLECSKLFFSCIVFPDIIFGDLFANVVIGIVDAVWCRWFHKLSWSMLNIFIDDFFLDFKVVMIFVLSEGVLAFDEEEIGLFIFLGIVGLFCYVFFLSVRLIQIFHWSFREDVLNLCYKNSNIQSIWRYYCRIDY